MLAMAIGSATFFGAQLKSSLSIPSFYENFDLATGLFKEAGLAEQLKQAIESLS